MKSETKVVPDSFLELASALRVHCPKMYRGMLYRVALLQQMPLFSSGSQRDLAVEKETVATDLLADAVVEGVDSGWILYRMVALRKSIAGTLSLGG